MAEPDRRERASLRRAAGHSRVHRLLPGQGPDHRRCRSHSARSVRAEAISMIAQFILSILLAGVLVYAWSEYARSPAIAVLAAFVTMARLYFVWMPEHSTQLTALVGLGRGVDLRPFVWGCLGLVVLL